MKKASNFWYLLSAILIGLILVIAGCSGEKGATADKKTLIYATASDATRLDPQMMTDIPSFNPMYAKVYQPLILLDKDGKLQPLLATEWKNINATTWEFKLRKEVKFHDGTPFNAAAVKKSFDRLADEKNKKANRIYLENLKEVKIIDDYTIQIITKAPMPALLQNLSHISTSIISPKAIDESETKSLDQNPVGTGPFKLEKWTKGESMTLVAAPGYWGKKPAIEKIVFKVAPEDTTRMGMVQRNEAQIADKVPFNDVDRYTKEGKFAIIRTPGNGTEFIGLNLKKEKFQDLRVRTAIDMSIDRKALLGAVFQGVGLPGISTLGPKVFGYNPNLTAPEYNPTKAKELLKEAGVPNLNIVLWTSTNNKARLKMAEIIQAQLKDAGITVEIKTLEWGAFLDAHHKGETEMYIMGWGNTSGDAGTAFVPVWSKEGFGNSNGSFYSKPEVESLFAQAAIEMDVEKRKALYQQAQQIIAADEVRFVVRVNEYVSLANKNIKGIAFTPSELLLIDDLVIE